MALVNFTRASGEFHATAKDCQYSFVASVWCSPASTTAPRAMARRMATAPCVVRSRRLLELATAAALSKPVQRPTVSVRRLLKYCSGASSVMSGYSFLTKCVYCVNCETTTNGVRRTLGNGNSASGRLPSLSQSINASRCSAPPDSRKPSTAASSVFQCRGRSKRAWTIHCELDDSSSVVLSVFAKFLSNDRSCGPKIKIRSS
jgi:hypothetical protein